MTFTSGFLLFLWIFLSYRSLLHLFNEVREEAALPKPELAGILQATMTCVPNVLLIGPETREDVVNTTRKRLCIINHNHIDKTKH